MKKSKDEVKVAKSTGAWKSVMLGGVPGVLLGSAGMAAAHEISDYGDVETEGHSDVDVPVSAEYATSVNDDMSFGEAFAAARSEVGPGGVFEWQGNLYGTYTQEEWNTMSEEQHSDFAEAVASADVPEISDSDGSVVGETVADDEPAAVAEPADSADVVGVDSEPANDGVGAESDIVDATEVEVLGAESVTGDDGSVQNVVAASVDGHNALFVDADADGYVDVIAVDSDDNGKIIGEELTDTQNSDLHVLDLASAEDMGLSTPENDIYEDTPDYTNDADVSSMV